jgi:EAL and modified HD-GYP domain-containing signal transduction protein
MNHAINMMGLGSLKKWLMLVFITDLDPSPRAQELALRSIQRAKFLESLQGECKCTLSPDTMFLLGLFSHLDALLGMPMQDVTKNLPLDDELKSALKGEKTKPAVWLVLLRSIETGEWNKVERILNHYALGKDEAARLYNRAGLLARKLLGYSRADR